MVKTAFFQPAEPQPGPATAPMADLEPAFEDATVNLRRLAQLRDAGVITEAEFQAKKEDLLAGHRAARRQRSWYSAWRVLAWDCGKRPGCAADDSGECPGGLCADGVDRGGWHRVVAHRTGGERSRPARLQQQLRRDGHDRDQRQRVCGQGGEHLAAFS